MALIELEEDEVRRLQAEHAAAAPAKAVFDKIVSKSPETRLEMLRLIKKVSPETPIPELDAAQPVLDEVSKVRKEFDDFRNAINGEKAEAAKRAREAGAEGEIAKGRQYLRSLGYDDDGVKAVEAHMEKRGLVDYEAAEAHFAKAQPADEPIIPSNYGQSWDLFQPRGADDPLGDILKMGKTRAERAIRSWSEKEARATLNDIRNGRVAA